MDVDSPENLSDDFCGFLKEDGGLDLNFETDKETYADDYVYDSFPSNSELHVEPAHNQEEYSLHSDMRKFDFAGSPSENFHLLTEADFSDDFCLNVPTSENNPDNFQFQLRDSYCQVEREGFCGNNYKSSFDIEEGTLDDKTEIGVAAELKESSSLEDTNQKQEAGLMPLLFPSENSFAESFLELSNYELTRSETACVEVGDEISVLQKKTLCPSPSLHLGRGGSKCDDKYDSRKSPGDNEKLEVIQSSRCNIENVMLNSKSSGAITQMFKLSSVSPGADLSPASQRTFVTQEDQYTENAVLNSKSSGTIVQMFLSSVSPGPDQSPASQTTFLTQEDQSKVLRSHRSSTERSDSDKLVASDINSLNPLKKDSASLHGSEKVPQHRDNYPVELYNTSNRNHESPQELHRHDRSRSPTRRRESSSKHRKDHYRSRSRSPYRRNHYIRSPRRRYSPRQKSPPSRSHCYNRSSRRQPWSPPHNRNTGLGKPGRNLFVAGFSFVTTERDLERKFSRFGRVRDIRIVRDKRSGDSRGFGFLTLERDTDADAAIRALDQTEWNGRIILVEKSKSY